MLPLSRIVRQRAMQAPSRDISFLRRLGSDLWSGRLLQVPRGFEKYFPKRDGSKGTAGGAAKNASGPQQQSGASSSSSKTSGGGSGGGGGSQNPFGGNKKPGGGGKPTDNVMLMTSVGVLSAATLALSFVNSKKIANKEISWQEFQNSLLPSGSVDRIDIVNKSFARIVHKNPAAGSTSSPSSSDWGSHDSFPPSSQDHHNEAERQQQEQRDRFFNSAKGRSPVQQGAPQQQQPHEDTIVDNNFIKVTRQQPSEIIVIGSVDSFERKLDDAQRELGIAPRDRLPVFYVEEVDWLGRFIEIAPTLILAGFLLSMMRGGGPQGNLFNMGKSRVVRAAKEDIKVSFKDVAGCDPAKKEIMEFVEFLRDHRKFTDLGAKIPKGALLLGPPGTGKTLLAKATAGEANVPFFSISGSDFTEMFVGVGASRVRDLFKQARDNAPSIIFIDEIDAVGGKRGRNMMGGNSERENTLNQLLVEMDGFSSTDNIVVLAGTNRVDTLDPALLRPGRFDRQITVDKPDIQGRKEIFEVYLKKIKLNGPMEDFSSRLAALTPGFAGADIANICNEAAIVAARKNKKDVSMEDFEAATDRVIGGLESSKLISPEEKKIVAYHEAGHAVAGWFLQYADPLLKVTIVPRGSGTLGFAQYLPKELFLRTKDQILDMVCMALAGRAAEQVNFGKVTSGAADDLRRVTQIVYQMVQVYGMNSSIGQVSFPQDNQSQFGQERMYSEATAELIDAEVRDMVDQAYKRTVALMEERKEQVKLVAELLLKKETISHTDVADLIGDRPFSAGKEYESYLAHARRKPTETASAAAESASVTSTASEPTPGASPVAPEAPPTTDGSGSEGQKP